MPEPSLWSARYRPALTADEAVTSAVVSSSFRRTRSVRSIPPTPSRPPSPAPLKLHFALPAERRRAQVAELLGAVGLSERFASRFSHELSGGRRRRVSIARVLAAEPSVPLCDEITSALDEDTAERLMTLLRDLRAGDGQSIAGRNS
ncbi:ATP-binding cassette domain-containing protein [Streptomyces sp. NPDC002690]